MMAPTISIALCTFNASKFLDEELESIAAQTCTPDELVACDDGSQDNTIAILERFAARVSFPVRIVRNPVNLGRTRNFDKAIRLCSGELIALADFDDVWKSRKLEVLRAAMQSEPRAGYAFSDGDMIAEDGSPLRRRLWQNHRPQELLLSGFPPESQVEALLKCGMATGATMMIRGSIKRLVLPISDLWIQDYWISLVASLLGAYGRAIAEPLLYYRAHSAQMTGLARRSVWQRSRASLGMPPEVWRQELRAFEQLRDHVVRQPGYGPRAAELLENKVRHLRYRAQARSAAGLARRRIVVQEMLTGRYRRFSNSWTSVVQDLFF